MEEKTANSIRFYIVNNGKKKRIVATIEHDGGFVYYDLKLADGENKNAPIVQLTPINDIVDVCGSPNIKVEPFLKDSTKLGNPSLKFLEKIYKYFIKPNNQEAEKMNEEKDKEKNEEMTR